MFGRLFVRRPEVHRIPKMLSEADMEMSWSEVWAEAKTELEMALGPPTECAITTAAKIAPKTIVRRSSNRYDLFLDTLVAIPLLSACR
jgi:hypothetical protein